MVDFPSTERPPERQAFDCLGCEKITIHNRCAVNLPARYMGETAVYAEVYGGSNDTMGNGRVEPLPKPPKELESKGDFMDWVHNPERKERLQKRAADRAANRKKRERAAKLKKAGEKFDLRKHRMPGDPKI